MPLAADAHDFAVGQDQFEARDVIGRHSVGQRVRAAGIFGDVSADRARFLAGRIGREIKAQVLDRAGQVEIHDSGLNNRAKIRGIDFENVVHARERHHNAAVAGNRSAGKSRARAAPHDRSFIAICEADDPSDIACRGRKNDAPGRSQLHRPVIFVQHQIFGRGQDRLGPQQCLEFADELRLHLSDFQVLWPL